MLAVVPKRSFGIGSFTRQQVKAFGRSLPFYELETGPCGSQVSAEGLDIRQSQAGLPRNAKEASLRGTAFHLLELALGIRLVCGFGQQLGPGNGKGESGGQITCPK